MAVSVDSRWGNAALPELLRVGPADVRKSFSGKRPFSAGQIPAKGAAQAARKGMRKSRVAP